MVKYRFTCFGFIDYPVYSTLLFTFLLCCCDFTKKPYKLLKNFSLFLCLSLRLYALCMSFELSKRINQLNI